MEENERDGPSSINSPIELKLEAEVVSSPTSSSSPPLFVLTVASEGDRRSGIFEGPAMHSIPSELGPMSHSEP